jgi:hypothetical protein
MKCEIIRNTELLLNEAHSNNFLFILERVPSSFLLSKFREDDFKKIGVIPDGTLESIVKNGLEYIKESNQDTYNFSMFLQSFTLPDLNLDTSVISTAFADLNAITGKLKFGTLNLNLIGDENWFIYRMLLYWMYAASNPEEFNNLTGRKYAKEFYMNGHLMLLDNDHQKVVEFEFRDLHIQTIGQQELTYQDANKIILPTTWVYSTFVPSDDYKILKDI